jgi:HSP20 family molecular chaperone IbpA
MDLYHPFGSIWNSSWWTPEEFEFPLLASDQPSTLEVGRQRPGGLRLRTNTRLGQFKTERKDNELVIKAQLPGVSRDDVILELKEDEQTGQSVLVLNADKKEEDRQNDSYGGYFQHNSEFHIMRMIPLGAKVTAGEIKADLADDQLVIGVKLPQVATQKPMSRIDITESSPKNIAQKTQPTSGKSEAMDTDIPVQ